MSDEIEIDQDIDIPLDVIEDTLASDQRFINLIRLSLSMDARRRGNTLGRWAQKQPIPKSVQPNTKQRVF